MALPVQADDGVVSGVPRTKGFLSTFAFSLAGGAPSALCLAAGPHFLTPGLTVPAAACLAVSTFSFCTHLPASYIAKGPRDLAVHPNAMAAGTVAGMFVPLGLVFGGVTPTSFILLTGTIFFLADRASTYCEVAASLQDGVDKHKAGRKVLAGTLAGAFLSVALNYAATTGFEYVAPSQQQDHKTHTAPAPGQRP